MATRRRAKAVEDELKNQAGEVVDGSAEVPLAKDELTASAQVAADENMASMTAKVAQLEAAIASLLPKVPQPKAPFDKEANSMDRVDEWVNEFTTEEVLKYIESAAIEENGINGATLYAYRQRQAFEHKKAINDPTNCPGWFITISGNIRRDY